MKAQVLSAPNSTELLRQRTEGVTPWGPPLGTPRQRWTVVNQVKRDTVHLEKSFQKIGEFQKGLE